MSQQNLQPLIEAVEKATHSHVVVFMSEEGIHWRDQTESSCQCMADILGNCKVMPREEFLAGLREVAAEHKQGHKGEGDGSHIG